MRRRPKTGERKPWARAGAALAAVAAGCACFWAATSGPARAAGGDLRVSASVDREEMDPNDLLVLTVTAKSSSDRDVRIPTGRELASGPLKQFAISKEWEESGARSQMVSDGQGNMRFDTVHTRSRSFTLQPKGAGTLVIGPIEVTGGGESFETKPIRVRVAPGASPGLPRAAAPQRRGAPPPIPPEDDGDSLDVDDPEDLFAQLLRRQGLPVPPGFGSNGAQAPPSARSPLPPGGYRSQPANPQEAFFVQVEVDKTEAYVGEQVTASWYLYTRGLIRDLDTLKYPSLKGFWKEDIEIATHLNFVQDAIGGVPYKKALLASFALFPIKEGTAVIDPYTAKCSVISADDPFGAFSGKAYTYTKSSGPVKIAVKPVPVEGRPADFGGAVGEYEVNARVDDPKAIQNQPLAFKVRFQGRGNAKLIEPPTFQPPDGFELYETQKDSKFFKTGVSFKDFTYLLIPRKAGTFTIPAVAVSIFDPEQKKFVQKTTQPVTVVVAPGAPGGSPSKPLAISSGGPADSKPLPPAPDAEFVTAASPSASAPAYGLAGLFVASSAGLLARARSRLGWGRKRRALASRIRERFSKLESLRASGDVRGCAREAINAFYWAIGEASGQGGANAEIEKLLEKAPPSVRREIGAEAAQAMDKLQALAFAPEGAWGELRDPEALRSLLKSTEALLSRAASLAESYERSV